MSETNDQTQPSEPSEPQSPLPRSIKRDNEGNPKPEPTAPPTNPETNTTTKPPPPQPSPTSEVKKQHAALSLTQLFTTHTQDSHESGTHDTLGEAGNFLAECFSGDGEGEHGHLAVDPSAANSAGEGHDTPTVGNLENVPPSTVEEGGSHELSGEEAFVSPRKKSRGETVQQQPARVSTESESGGGSQETPLAMKAGAYRLNKLMEATKFTSPMPEHPPPPPPIQQPVQAPPPFPAVQPIHAHDTHIALQAEPPKRLTANRKEKSLALLCQNFMDLCRDAPACGPNDETGALVELNELATHLGVKRRRIYDIINIMESVHIVSRLKKNTYRWHGLENLPLYFARLQKEGLKEIRQGLQPDKQIKGMSLTCQKLIQYFLITGCVEIRLTDAAEAVLGPSHGEDKTFKTKIRRMYDIANVLTALGIIRKENLAGTTAKSQPSFRWVYPISPQDMYHHLPPGEQTGEPVQLVPHDQAVSHQQVVPPPPQHAIAPQQEPLIPPEEPPHNPAMQDLAPEMDLADAQSTSGEANTNPVTPEERQTVVSI